MFKGSVFRVLLIAMELTEWCELQPSRAVRIPRSPLLSLIMIALSQGFAAPLVRLEKISSISIRSKRPTKLGDFEDPKSLLLHLRSNEKVEIQKGEGP